MRADPAALREAAVHLSKADRAEVRAIGREIESWLAGGAQEPLDEALGLKGWGGASLRYQLHLADRDAQLRQLAREHREWSGLDLSMVVRSMLEAWGRYETGRWPRDRVNAIPPAAEPAATFWRLLRAGQRMPGAKRLRSILQREIQEPV